MSRYFHTYPQAYDYLFMLGMQPQMDLFHWKGEEKTAKVMARGAGYFVLVS